MKNVYSKFSQTKAFSINTPISHFNNYTYFSIWSFCGHPLTLTPFALLWVQWLTCCLSKFLMYLVEHISTGILLRYTDARQDALRLPAPPCCTRLCLYWPSACLRYQTCPVNSQCISQSCLTQKHVCHLDLHERCW